MVLVAAAIDCCEIDTLISQSGNIKEPTGGKEKRGITSVPVS